MRNDFCTNYLEHSAKGTSWAKKGAKYLKRVWKNGKWLYYYSKKSSEWNYQVRDRARMRRTTVNLAGYQAIRKEDTSWAKDQYNKDTNSMKRAARMSDTYYNLTLGKATELFGKKGGQIITDILSGLTYVSDTKGANQVREDAIYYGDTNRYGTKRYKGH